MTQREGVLLPSIDVLLITKIERKIMQCVHLDFGDIAVSANRIMVS